jgi:putative NAD(P)-binding protein
MTPPDRPVHVVFGATGAVGTAVAAELVRRSETVRAVSRRGQAPQGAEGVAADAADPAQVAAAAAGATVIYHCASPPYTRWPELFPALTRSILGAPSRRVPSWCSPTTCTPTGRSADRCARTCPPRPRGRKGRTRVAMAAEILR